MIEVAILDTDCLYFFNQLQNCSHDFFPNFAKKKNNDKIPNLTGMGHMFPKYSEKTDISSEKLLYMYVCLLTLICIEMICNLKSV